MSGKNCANHPNSPSVTMCGQCQKPICKSCVMVTATGTFCSSECSIISKELRHKGGGGGGGRRKGGGAGMALVFLVLLAVAALFGIHFAAKKQPPDHFLKKIDLVGRLLDKPAE